MRSMDIIPAKRLSGEINVPGDKSISHRAIMCGAIADGKTVVSGILDCDDCDYTLRAFKDMGVRIERAENRTTIYGAGPKGLADPGKPINTGNSGTSMRVLSGILAGQDFEATLTGEEGLSKRPMKRIIDPLMLMGSVISSAPGGFPPIRISPGKIKAIDYTLPVPSAQVKSAILFAGLYASGRTTVEEKIRSRDHTERMLKYFGADVKVDGLRVSINGPAKMSARDFGVPGDISSASFLAAGAVLLNNSKIRISRVSVNPTRTGILNIMSRMGARCGAINRVEGFEPYGDIEAESGPITGIDINENEIPGIIDELPIIFVLASLAKGRTVITGADELRVKETDRIASMKQNLDKMGAKMSIDRNRIVIDGVEKLKGARLKSYGDHRTCMSMAMAALCAEGASSIDDVECVNKSFPGFFKLLETIRS
ncbi:MAG: 3-phosphoshikimate 1-carboxyvinyltransferase [Candidatus Omnitrophica bacterium]|nr:3-phosphoshikimate 1-carboxyvinyltransferase [Candidatus Omnitrophota bacterium]MBU1809169.1 3-phosphoshikimate 1-carboxyvinyltransferase [Candidatus Omnitrophota bacterium]